MFFSVTPLKSKFEMLQGCKFSNESIFKLPFQLSKLALGSSQKTSPLKLYSYWSLKVFIESERSFKFVSPSRFIVETKTISFGAQIRSKSAGTS